MSPPGRRRSTLFIGALVLDALPGALTALDERPAIRRLEQVAATDMEDE